MADPLPEEALRRELEGMEEALRRSGSPQGDCATLRLSRVAAGVTAAQWERLRQELGLEGWTAEPAPQDGELDAFVRREMDRARLCQLPLALACIRTGRAHAAVLELVRGQLRSFDHAARLEDGVIAVCLSGTPLASAERQLASLVRRIRHTFEPALDCSAGLIGFGGLAQTTAQALLENARQALEQALRLGGNRLEVAPSADAALASRETLVRASEKHFLFTGRPLPDTRESE